MPRHDMQRARECAKGNEPRTIREVRRVVIIVHCTQEPAIPFLLRPTYSLGIPFPTFVHLSVVSISISSYNQYKKKDTENPSNIPTVSCQTACTHMLPVVSASDVKLGNDGVLSTEKKNCTPLSCTLMQPWLKSKHKSLFVDHP